MKAFKIVFSLLVFFSLSFTSSHAQIVDTLPFFKVPGKFLDSKIIDWNSTYILQKASPQASIVKKSTSIPVGRSVVKLPRSIKELNTPLKLKGRNGCYLISCQASQNCRDCRLLWKDINRDGKVQPRRELRCVCTSSGGDCRIRAKKIPCG